MNNTLTNIADTVGIYNSISTALTSEAVVTQLVSGLTIVKTADKESWADGNLSYTVTVTNAAGNDDYENPVLTDILDPALITLVAGSVTINGVPATESEYTFDEITGTLTVNIPTISSSSSGIVTFQVQKI